MRISHGGEQTLTIASGAQLSDAAELGEPCDYLIVACPATLTSCTLNIHASVDGTTYYQLGISEVTPTTTGSACFSFKMGGFSYAKINSSVAQGGARTFTVAGVVR